MASVTQLIEHEEAGSRHKFESILQLILSYAKFGMIKYGDEPLSDERVQTVFGLMDQIDHALITHSAKERLRVVSLILIRCWDTIRDFLEVCKQRQEESAASGGSTSASETVAEALRSIVGSSGLASGSTSPVPDSGTAEEKSATEASRARTRMDAEEITPSEDSGQEAKTLVEEQAPQSDGETQSDAESSSEESQSEEASGASESDVWIPMRFTAQTVRSSARTISPMRSPSLPSRCCWTNPAPCAPATVAPMPAPPPSSSMTSVRAWASR